MLQYARKLSAEIAALQGEEVAVAGRLCKFICGLVPVDMKYLATLSGELCNAATYFSSFADVSQQTKSKSGSFQLPDHSADSSAVMTWKSWSWTKRLEDAHEVEKFKAKLQGDLESKTNRSKITTFIASRQSRQEFVPPLGRSIELARAEPLHLMNNAWQNLFELVLLYACRLSSGQLHPTSPLFKLVDIIQNTLRLHKLNRGIKLWLEDKSEANMHKFFRFTGNESRKCCHNFHRFIEALNTPQRTAQEQVKLHTLSLAMAHLRDAVALFSRYSITDAQLDALEMHCRAYFCACRDLLQTVTPTSWTIGHVVPVHARDVKRRFGFGLGLATAQGREAKVVDVKKYMHHALVKDMPKMVFRHEYMSLIALQKKDPQHVSNNHEGKNKYVPIPVERKEVCYCGGQLDMVVSLRCAFCREGLHYLVAEDLANNKISPKLQRIMQPSQNTMRHQQ